MIIPQQTDLGRRVVYQPPGAGRRYGIISAIYPRRVFIRLDGQHDNRAVDPAHLKFAKATDETRKDSDEQSQSALQEISLRPPFAELECDHDHRADGDYHGTNER